MNLPSAGVLSQSPNKPLPQEALALIDRLDVPPRLLAHLILVHDCASELIERVARAFPNVQMNRTAILFGAATHDLGKTIVREELSRSGNLHQARGFELLKELGAPAEKARFALTHGQWRNLDSPQIEDLLVALADKCWKAKRVEDLEAKLVELLSKESGQEPWQCHSTLDEILQELAAEADKKLAWQLSFPVESRPPAAIPDP